MADVSRNKSETFSEKESKGKEVHANNIVSGLWSNVVRTVTTISSKWKKPKQIFINSNDDSVPPAQSTLKKNSTEHKKIRLERRLRWKNFYHGGSQDLNGRKWHICTNKEGKILSWVHTASKKEGGYRAILQRPPSSTHPTGSGIRHLIFFTLYIFRDNREHIGASKTPPSTLDEIHLPRGWDNIEKTEKTPKENSQL